MTGQRKRLESWNDQESQNDQKSQNDRQAGTTGKPERPASRNDQINLYANILLERLFVS
jgi:hypothetical protein